MRQQMRSVHAQQPLLQPRLRQHVSVLKRQRGQQTPIHVITTQLSLISLQKMAHTPTMGVSVMSSAILLLLLLLTVIMLDAFIAPLLVGPRPLDVRALLSTATQLQASSSLGRPSACRPFVSCVLRASLSLVTWSFGMITLPSMLVTA